MHHHRATDAPHHHRMMMSSSSSSYVFLLLLSIVLLVEARPYHDIIDRKLYLCGIALDTAISHVCKTTIGYDSNVKTIPKPGDGITEMCCHRPCSQREIMQHYCQDVNSQVLEMLQQANNIKKSTVQTVVPDEDEQPIPVVTQRPQQPPPPQPPCNRVETNHNCKHVRRRLRRRQRQRHHQRTKSLTSTTTNANNRNHTIAFTHSSSNNKRRRKCACGAKIKRMKKSQHQHRTRKPYKKPHIESEPIHNVPIIRDNPDSHYY